MNTPRLWLAIIAIGASLPAHAADIRLQSGYFSANHPVPQLSFSGPVVEGDVEQLRAVFETNASCNVDVLPADGGNCAILTLASPGGNYVEGLLLAQFLRDHKIATLIEPGAECY